MALVRAAAVGAVSHSMHDNDRRRSLLCRAVVLGPRLLRPDLLIGLNVIAVGAAFRGVFGNHERGMAAHMCSCLPPSVMVAKLCAFVSGILAAKPFMKDDS